MCIFYLLFILQICFEKGWQTIIESQIQELEQLSKLLTPFLNAITKLQSEKMITSSLVFGIIQSLIFLAKTIRDQNGFAKDAAVILLDELNCRFGKFVHNKSETDPHFVLCALLDPSQAYLLQDFDNNLLSSWLASALVANDSEFEDPETTQQIYTEETSFEQMMHVKSLKRQQADSQKNTKTKAARDYVDAVLSNKGPEAKLYWSGRGKVDHASFTK